ncbi:membrane-bound O-acyltransferase Gup1p [[Candida] railenensis]|uniref:Membrane-bound O-acyltransferase Gup1p n=1 Tax=[Candida] railenensis TaxID=45579 RepID=A0A9P0QTU5_9ASCO|nr:membrane-bound O-acyltransferase Gup1p [[Candida] railenensis]
MDVSTITSVVRNFFSLETLDTRLHAPSSIERKNAIIAKANIQSKWNTLEYKIYGIIFVIAVPLMAKTAIEASNENNPNYPKFKHLLSQGWLFGREVDNSDTQYKFFRDNLPMLGGMILIHFACRQAATSVYPALKRTKFDFIYGMLFLLTAHGTNSIKILIHLGINYLIGKIVVEKSNKKTAILLTWVYGISTLFFNDYFRDHSVGISFIDKGWKGIISRWDVFFNFTLLRMLSFNLDYLERREKSNETSNERGDKSSEYDLLTSNLDDRSRLTAPLPITDYSGTNYLAYVLYTPLFIAGPIITFNDFIYQSNYKSCPSVKNWKRTFIYFLRLVFCILVMEFILHFMYVVAVSKTNAWEGNSPFQISMVGMFNLNIIWLKLLIPWRILRFWALLDGIDPPENMIRCMDNNYSALAFWRAWHRSFNKWVTRYIYIPLGGGGYYRFINMLCVFSFVAIWHDIELKLLIWGWLIVIFLLPEILATFFFKRYESTWWYNYVCAAGAVVNIWMMMIANLFGFCLGQDGTLKLLKEMFSTVGGIEFFLTASGALFVGVQIMYELRQDEMRRGISVRC